MVRRGDVFSGLLLAGLGAYTGLEAWGYGLGSLSVPGAGFFPFLGAVLVMACSATVALRALLQSPKRYGGFDVDEGESPSSIKIALAVAILIAYAILLPIIGFAPTTFLGILCLARLDRRMTWKSAVATAGISALGFWFIFVRQLEVSFPSPMFRLF